MTTTTTTWTTLSDFIDRAWNISRADSRTTRESEWDAIRAAGVEYELPAVHGYEGLGRETFADDCESYLGFALQTMRDEMTNADMALHDDVMATL